MDYIDQSGKAALRGIHQTGRLDDRGLPELAWYGQRVRTLTAENIIREVLKAVDFPNLDPDEQGIIANTMLAVVGGRKFQQQTVRSILRSAARKP